MRTMRGANITTRALLAAAALALASTALGALPAKRGPTGTTPVSWQGRWVRYDRDKCGFVPAPSQKTFAASLLRQPGMRLVYTPAGRLTDVDVTLNDSTRAAARSAQMTFYEYANDFPSVKQ